MPAISIPRRLGDLGVDERARRTHIGWDIGALGVARRLSALLDATLVAQRYSRLVIDCNRILDARRRFRCAASAPRSRATSRSTTTPAARASARSSSPTTTRSSACSTSAARGPIARRCFSPFTASRRSTTACRARGTWRSRPTTTGRSPTRCWPRCADDPDLVVGDNEPYSVDDVDYTDPDARRASRPAARVARDPQRPDRDRGGAGGVGAATGRDPPALAAMTDFVQDRIDGRCPAAVSAR